MIIKYYNKDKLCSTISVDKNKVSVTNYTEDIFHQAFGSNTKPTIDDLNEFLESRCFPRTRANIKDLLAGLGIDAYDPIEIIKKTQGRMAEDNSWVMIEE